MKTKLSMVVASLLLGATLFTGCGSSSSDDSAQKEVTSESKQLVLTSYANTALSDYTAALNDAKSLKTALEAFNASPTDATLTAAKDAWLQSRETYGVTEIYRLSNGPIDAEEGYAATFGAPEGQLNAWPLDENMIDYSTDDTGATTSGNIIDTVGSFTPDSEDSSSTAVDVTSITADALAELNENGGDANVATGYHAIEFLIWGQDQDYTGDSDGVTTGPLAAGERPLTDYTTAANADRRKAYLVAAADLIISDLQSMVDAWDENGDNYRNAFLNEGDNAIATDTALTQVMAGMGVFIKSELANERMAVAIQTPSEEDEHSCFSDNTHRDIALNYEGFKNALVNTGMLEYATEETQEAVNTLIAEIDTGVDAINTTAENSEHFDYQIKASSANRQNAFDTKNNMRDLGDLMIDVADAYSISLTDEDVTDGEESDVDPI